MLVPLHNFIFDTRFWYVYITLYTLVYSRWKICYFFTWWLHF